MKYRPEIDGLRTIAVVPVILYHAGSPIFSGGFAGVDVFFVISGYLISSILISDIEKGQFSLARFYERRARRILPALTVMVLACIPFAWLWMTPNQLQSFTNSVVAVGFFVSNILFWKESDYFAPDAELSPLLHTWSLAVEEQFYILFPLVLLLIWKLRHRPRLALILVLTGGSLVLAQLGSRVAPSANFYLLPSRAWELLAGALCAMHLLTRDGQPRRSHALSLVGLALVLVPMFLYDSSTPFPSLWTVPTVLGTSLIILFAERSTMGGRSLALTPMVGIGLISYSAYLWHQPLMAFARLRGFEHEVPYLMQMLAVASLVLAWLSWKYIEAPFRKPTGAISTRAGVFTGTAAVMALFGAIGIAGYAGHGFPMRYSDQQLAVLAWEDYDESASSRTGICFMTSASKGRDIALECAPGDARVMLWGDSHAAALSYGLSHLLPIIQITAPNCPPLMPDQPVPTANCAASNARGAKFLQERRPDIVILQGNWAAMQDNLNIGEALLHDTLVSMQALSPGTKFILAGGVPQWRPSLPVVLSRYDITPEELASHTPEIADVRRADQMLMTVAEDMRTEGVTYLSLLESVCGTGTCQAVAPLDAIDSGVPARGPQAPLVWDYGHLTGSGAVHIADVAFKSILSPTH